MAIRFESVNIIYENNRSVYAYRTEIYEDGTCVIISPSGVETMKTQKVEIDKELYKAWLEDEVKLLETMDLEAVQSRIIEIEKGIFEAKTRLAEAHKKRVKLSGSKWADHSKEISDPKFVVNFNADPRKKSKPKGPKLSRDEKNKQLMEAAGIDTNKLKELLKQKMAEKALKDAGIKK